MTLTIDLQEVDVNEIDDDNRLEWIQLVMKVAFANRDPVIIAYCVVTSHCRFGEFHVSRCFSFKVTTSEAQSIVPWHLGCWRRTVINGHAPGLHWRGNSPSATQLSYVVGAPLPCVSDQVSDHTYHLGDKWPHSMSHCVRETEHRVGAR